MDVSADQRELGPWNRLHPEALEDGDVAVAATDQHQVPDNWRGPAVHALARDALISWYGMAMRAVPLS